MPSGYRVLVKKEGKCNKCNKLVIYCFERLELLCKSCLDKKNPDLRRQSVRNSYSKNRSKYRETQRAYRKQRLANDIEYRLAKNLRARVSNLLKGAGKYGSAVQDLGCSLAEFRFYLESKFQPGMTWENYSFAGWHIDHIKPLNSFNLLDPAEFKLANHFSNLQPLWASDNFSKGGRSGS
jgi:hypothetical protein